MPSTCSGDITDGSYVVLCISEHRQGKMEILFPVDSSPHCNAIKLVHAYCKSDCKVVPGTALSMKTAEGSLTGINTICKVLASSSQPDLCGVSPEAVAQV